MQQVYILQVRDLGSMSKGEQYGAETYVAILEDGAEVGREVFRGKCKQHQRRYTGRPGLSAVIITGPGSITMTAKRLA